MHKTTVSFWHHAFNFINSSFFIAIITILVGATAFIIYRRQKIDAKRNAANIILLEIESAEQQLSRISVDTPFTDTNQPDVVLMSQSSWDKFKFMFVQDFDRNEWDKISEFYTKCEGYDDAVKASNTVTQKNQQAVRVNMQRTLAKYAAEHADEIIGKSDSEKQVLTDAYIQRRQSFIDVFMNTDSTHMYFYLPAKVFDDAKLALRDINSNLSLSSAGIQLKRIAHHKSLFTKIKEHFKG